MPLGETALFICAGDGYGVWIIDGQYDDDPAIRKRGVKVTYDITNSTLTIPGTMENDNVSIQYFLIGDDVELVYSPVVFLTVVGKLCIDDT